MRSDSETAWAAGLFEGEGCVTSGTCRTPEARLTMTDEDRVIAFRDVVGFGTLAVVPPPAKHPNWKTALKWRAGGAADVTALYEMFKPWLGPRRLGQFRSALAQHSAHAKRGLSNARPCPTCGHTTTPGPMVIHRRACVPAAEEALKLGFVDEIR